MDNMKNQKNTKMSLDEILKIVRKISPGEWQVSRNKRYEPFGTSGGTTYTQESYRAQVEGARFLLKKTNSIKWYWASNRLPGESDTECAESNDFVLRANRGNVILAMYSNEEVRAVYSQIKKSVRDFYKNLSKSMKSEKALGMVGRIRKLV